MSKRTRNNFSQTAEVLQIKDFLGVDGKSKTKRKKNLSELKDSGP